jgi:heme/copper-type cytochrome/quinol oxidase subunit 3
LHIARKMPAARRRQLAPNGVIGMLIFVFAEMMFVAGFISAHTIVKSGALGGWPPPGQPRLPIEQTAINTAALLTSGLVLFFAHRRFSKDAASARVPLAIAMALGTFFVAFQGMEWVALLSEGLTVTSSTHGAFFYLIVGAHGVHAVAALLGLLYCFVRLTQRSLVLPQLMAAEIFWYFVVAVWPFLYWRVYL